MKGKIETIGNIIVIVFAVVVGSVFLKGRFTPPPSEPISAKAGDRLPNLDGWDWSAHDQTLVLGLRKGCHFCEDSAPFYQKLLAQQQPGESSPAIVAVFPDTPEEVKGVVASEGLAVQTLAGVPSDKLKISGTPTLLLVDRTGTVLTAWNGMLSPRQELEVMRAAAGPVATALK
jgi:hypothetical protein